MSRILQNEYATVSMDGEKGIMEVTWLQHCEESVFREMLNRTLKHTNSHRITRWLYDMRGLRYILLTDQNLLARKLLPSLTPDLRHRFAYVVPF